LIQLRNALSLTHTFGIQLSANQRPEFARTPCFSLGIRRDWGLRNGDLCLKATNNFPEQETLRRAPKVIRTIDCSCVLISKNTSPLNRGIGLYISIREVQVRKSGSNYPRGSRFSQTCSQTVKILLQSSASLLVKSPIMKGFLLYLVGLSSFASAIPSQYEDDLIFRRAINGQCKAPEGTGSCQSTSNCPGISYPTGLCPKDPKDVQVRLCHIYMCIEISLTSNDSAV
jgi:hypothetical protein